MRVRKPRGQMRPRRPMGPPRSAIAAGESVTLVGILKVGRGQTHSAAAQIWTEHTCLCIKYIALSSLPCIRTLCAKHHAPLA